MKKIIPVLILISIISCNKLGETETEKYAVQKVLNFYDGECLKLKGFETKNGVEKDYYELIMSKSALLNNDSTHLKSHSANIAYLFYSNLENEKSNYNEIRIKINLDNGKRESYNYSDKELIEIENLTPKVNNITKCILEKDYEKLITEFDKPKEVKKENIVELFTKLERLHGKVKSSQFQGFAFITIPDYREVILMREVLTLDKISGNMLLIFDRKSKKLLSIEFP